MLETKVAKRYAKSLLDFSNESGQLEAVHQDMQLFYSVCKENREFSLLLGNPIIPSDKKRAILSGLFQSKVNKITNGFFDIVTRKGREKYLENIAKEFISQYKIYKGIRTAEITSAVGLDDTLRAAVYKLLRESTQSEVELSEKIDKNLIGGFVLRIGDKQYDASIASELRRLAREFSSNPYIPKN